jgi:protein TonB
MDGDSTNFEKYGSNYEPATVDVSPTVGVYLSKRFRCPEEAKKNQVVGNIVVSFTIDTTGTLINPVVKRGLRYGCDEEAIRLIKTLPKWKPAMKNNHPVEHKGEVRILVRCEE